MDYMNAVAACILCSSQLASMIIETAFPKLIGRGDIPVADLEFSADMQRQTVNIRLPRRSRGGYEWTVSLFADFRELKNDVILHPRVATIKYGGRLHIQ